MFIQSYVLPYNPCLFPKKIFLLFNSQVLSNDWCSRLENFEFLNRTKVQKKNFLLPPMNSAEHYTDSK